MSVSSKGKAKRPAISKHRNSGLSIYLPGSESRPWRFEISVRPVTLAVTLAASVATATVVHANLKPWLHHGLHNLTVKEVSSGSLANIDEGSAGLSLGSGPSDARESGGQPEVAQERPSATASGQGAKTTVRQQSRKAPLASGNSVVKASPARVAQAPESGKQQGGLHTLGRGAKHVGGLFSKPFHHKQSADSRTTRESERP